MPKKKRRFLILRFLKNVEASFKFCVSLNVMTHLTNNPNLSPKHTEVKSKTPILSTLLPELNKPESARNLIGIIGMEAYGYFRHRQHDQHFKNPAFFLENPSLCVASLSIGARLLFDHFMRHSLKRRVAGKETFQLPQALFAKAIGRRREYISNVLISELERRGLLRVWYNYRSWCTYQLSPVLFREKYFNLLAPYLMVCRTHSDLVKNLTLSNDNRDLTRVIFSTKACIASARVKDGSKIKDRGGGYGVDW